MERDIMYETIKTQFDRDLKSYNVKETNISDTELKGIFDGIYNLFGYDAAPTIYYAFEKMIELSVAYANYTKQVLNKKHFIYSMRPVLEKMAVSDRSIARTRNNIDEMLELDNKVVRY